MFDEAKFTLENNFSRIHLNLLGIMTIVIEGVFIESISLQACLKRILHREDPHGVRGGILFCDLERSGTRGEGR